MSRSISIPLGDHVNLMPPRIAERSRLRIDEYAQPLSLTRIAALVELDPPAALAEIVNRGLRGRSDFLVEIGERRLDTADLSAATQRAFDGRLPNPCRQDQCTPGWAWHPCCSR